MDVLGSSRNQYGLSRRRLRVDTPEINTYQRQILFCEKKCDKLNQKFRTPDPKQDATYSNRNVHKSLPAECWTNNGLGVSRESRKNSMDSFHAGLSRRKSSFQAHVNRKQIDVGSSSYPLENNRGSHHKIVANHRAPERCSSDSRVLVPAKDVLFNHDRKQSRQFSKPDPESSIARIGGADKDNNKSLRGGSRKQSHDYENGGMTADENSTSAAMEELNCALRRERDHFLRALTTLAINRITTEKPPIVPVERNNTTFTHYERSIDVLADGSRLTIDDEHVAPHLADDNNRKDGSSVSSSSDSDIYGTIEGVENNIIQPNPDKRERINRLRSYLKCSGFGDPSLIRITTQQSEDEKRAFTRLVRRINRGLSFEKQDRLKRKARLEYEMSLMKGESFCEQQEQVYMRTASADMENRDLQMLEEELRIQALREIRRSKKVTRKTSRSLSRQQSNSHDVTDNGLHRAHESLQRNSDGEVVVGVAEGNEVEDEKADIDEKSSSDDRDAMSGLIKNPVSRREMRKRILMWVYDVEDAMGVNQKEGEKLEKKLLRKDNKHHISSVVPGDKANEGDVPAVNTGET